MLASVTGKRRAMVEPARRQMPSANNRQARQAIVLLMKDAAISAKAPASRASTVQNSSPSRRAKAQNGARASRKASAPTAAKIRPDWKGGRPEGKGGQQAGKPAFQPKPREERPVRFDPDSPFAKLAALRDQLKK